MYFPQAGSAISLLPQCIVQTDEPTFVIGTHFQGLVSSHQQSAVFGVLVLQDFHISGAPLLPLRRVLIVVKPVELRTPEKT